MALQDALGKLQDTAASPLEQAFSSPPEIYTSPDMLELELREIFEREWHCPGLAADIAEPGDYVTFSIGDQPVFSIRQKDGSIRSFSNVCRHRMMQLLEGSGNTRTIVCPYHAWTYGQDGSLRGASQMEKSKAFNRQGLLPARNPHRDLERLDLHHAEPGCSARGAIAGTDE